jgi:hypothetical protein
MKDFEMTQEQLDLLIDAMSPVPMIAINVCTGLSRQARANNTWACLGRDMGFDYMTVKPNGKGDRFFSATETECQGIELGDGNHSGCDQSAGDCPTCGK